MDSRNERDFLETAQKRNCLQSAYRILLGQSKTLPPKQTDENLGDVNKIEELDVITHYLNSILSHMAQGLLFVNLEGYITTCNRAAETLLGINMFKLLFQQYTAHFSDDFFGFSMEQVIKSRKAPLKTITTILTSQGAQHKVEVDSSMVLHDSNTDELKGIILLLRDVTEFQRLQEMANRRDRFQALGEMAGMMAHEVRNPLGSIKGFASLLIRDLNEQPALQQMARSIEEGADNLNKLVTNILNYSRPLSPHLVEMDLLILLRDLCRQIEVDDSLNKHIRLSFQSPLVALTALVDESLLKSALLNLIKNAIQAMPKGGVISLSLEKQDPYIAIKVEDQGLGITPENLKKLFTPFFTTKQQGNGFGLAEVQRVIQAHNGIIEVESIVNKGTLFTIKLPL